MTHLKKFTAVCVYCLLFMLLPWIVSDWATACLPEEAGLNRVLGFHPQLVVLLTILVLVSLQVAYRRMRSIESAIRDDVYLVRQQLVNRE